MTRHLPGLAENKQETIISSSAYERREHKQLILSCIHIVCVLWKPFQFQFLSTPQCVVCLIILTIHMYSRHYCAYKTTNGWIRNDADWMGDRKDHLSLSFFVKIGGMQRSIEFTYVVHFVGISLRRCSPRYHLLMRMNHLHYTNSNTYEIWCQSQFRLKSCSPHA